jgi:hypothetical protein
VIPRLRDAVPRLSCAGATDVLTSRACAPPSWGARPQPGSDRSPRTVNHSEKEYAYLANDGHLATTNTAEGYFANLKRQLNGTHHHTSKKHLGRYLEEHDHNYNNRDMTDTERTEAAIGNIEGARVKLYKGTDGKGDSLFDHKANEPPVYYKGEVPEAAPAAPPKRKSKRRAKSGGACVGCGAAPCVCKAGRCVHGEAEGTE